MRRILQGLLMSCLVWAPSVSAGSTGADWINVRDHGAVGDGTVDDTTSIQDAIESAPLDGATIYFPAGDYKISSSVKIYRGDITVRCDNGARLVVGAPALWLLSIRGNVFPAGRLSNVRVYGCSFYDPDPAAHSVSEESHGIVVRDVDGAILRDLTFESMGDESVDIQRSTDVKLLDSLVKNGCAAQTVGYAGSLSVNSSSGVQIRGNTISSNDNGSAIRVENSQMEQGPSNIIIADNQIFDPEDLSGAGGAGGSAIVVVPSKGAGQAVVVSGNQIVRPHRYGIFVEPTLNASYTGLILRDNVVQGGGQGVRTVDGKHDGAINVSGQTSQGLIAGNVIDGWGISPAHHVGIRLRMDGFVVLANVITNVPGAAIWSDGDGSRGNMITGNFTSNTGGVHATPRDVAAHNMVDSTHRAPGTSAGE